MGLATFANLCVIAVFSVLEWMNVRARGRREGRQELFMYGGKVDTRLVGVGAEKVDTREAGVGD